MFISLEQFSILSLNSALGKSFSFSDIFIKSEGGACSKIMALWMREIKKLFAQNKQYSCLKWEKWLVGPERFEPTIQTKAIIFDLFPYLT
jgi:hypothetical protein